ncbi:MAG: flavodoxin family protein [Candidatus Lokiarchaeota archaeon]|nr:flavodoxin family protein [Candidatus Lokiarchaeota archaeon]
MKVLLVNGSARKNGNTATLLKKVAEGANSRGAETKLVHLYDLNYKGCTSCFSCKIKGGKNYGKCGFKDELTPILNEIETVDALVLGSPIYYGTVTGEMKSFMERLMFPYNMYANPYKTLFPRKIKTGFIFTMNQTEEETKTTGIARNCLVNEYLLKFTFGSSESLMSYDTYQFEDYSKVVQERFNIDKKEKSREEIFPQDCKKAFEMGKRFVS